MNPVVLATGTPDLDPVAVVADLAAAGVRRARLLAVAGSGVGVGVAFAAEHGDELDDEGAQDRETGADDGDVGLDDGPHDVGDVVGRVGGRGEDVEGGDTKARRDDDEYTKSENSHQSNLLRPRNLELVDKRHGQQQDDNIGGDGESSVGVPELAVVHTVTIQLPVEGLLDRSALEDRGKDRSNHVGSNTAEKEPAAPAEPTDLVKDTKV